MIYIASDHTGFELKEYIKEYLKSKNVQAIDVTEKYIESDDYPDVAESLCEKVIEKSAMGIAICGTGIGISIACNKIKGIRAGLCLSYEMADLAKRHNDINVMCLGSRLAIANDKKEINKMIDAFIFSKFEEDRHIRRIEKIVKLEEK